MIIRAFPLLFLTLQTAEASQTASGVVFVDANNNQRQDANERGVPKVVVSTDRDVVTTDRKGRFTIPLSNDTEIFVVKPSGYRTALTENNLPFHYYIHRPKGSPRTYTPGVAPTGPLKGLQFPLYPQSEKGDFEVVVMSDPQPATSEELRYVVKDVLSELVLSEASFGIVLGDIMYDKLSLFAPYTRALGKVGFPFYHVLGNHDVNMDATNDRDSDETFTRLFGPANYAFNWGRVHFVVLDNIRWLGRGAKRKYEETFELEQLAWLKKELQHVPRHRLVVICTHSPFYAYSPGNPIYVGHLRELFEVLNGRRVLALNGHTHVTNHHFFGSAEGWKGKKAFHQANVVTVSGAWWGGPRAGNGVPVADQRDGAPNGYTMVRFSKNDYQIRYRAAGYAADHQMRIYPPDKKGTLRVNVFDGIADATVELSVDRGPWQRMTQRRQRDPLAERYYASPMPQGKPFIRLMSTDHIFEQTIDQPARGAHLFHVRYRDRLKRSYQSTLIVRTR